VRDIATEPSVLDKFGLANTIEGRFAFLDEVVYYVDDDGIHGEELWRTDGTEQGTWIAADVSTGFLPSSPANLTVFDGELYFRATGLWWTVQPVSRIWRSDGTQAGTVRVTDTDGHPTSPWAFTEFNRSLFFRGSSPGAGAELWRLNEAGEPVLMVDIEPGTGGSRPTNFFPVGEELFFSADTSEYGRELWKTDGTPEGTSLVIDLLPGPDSALLEEGFERPILYFGALDGALVFAGDDGNGRVPWVTDGTIAGTLKLSDCENPNLFKPLAGKLYFECHGEEGSELWVTDGTARGTLSIKDIYPGPGSSGPSGLTVLGRSLFFSAADDVNGRELWQTDGTAEGTRLVSDIHVGQEGSSPGWLASSPTLDGILLFEADDGIHGRELWRTDGTAEGTELVADIYPGADDSIGGYAPPFVIPGFNHLLFLATSPAEGLELWRSDGSSEGTNLVRDVHTQASSTWDLWQGVPELRSAGNRVFFRATDTEFGTELWTTDGTAEGTLLVRDIHEGDRAPGLPFSSFPNSLTPVGDWIYFAAESRESDGLWRTHVETLETEPAITVDLDAYSHSYFLRRFGRELLFTASIEGAKELWITDGPDGGGGAGTRRLTEGGGSAYNVAVGETVAYFRYWTEDLGTELWMTDGTAEGTRLAADIELGVESSNPANLVTVGDRVVFTAETEATGREWWTSDGTAEGTRLLLDIEPGPESSIASTVASAPYARVEEPLREGDRIYLFAGSSETGLELWSTDGTTEGTRLVKDIRPGPLSSDPYELVATGGLVYFVADDGVHGRELWRTDGTEAGTLLVRDIEAGPGDAAPWFLVDYKGKLVFSAYTGESGVELWTSDGTELGTQQIAEFLPGPGSGSPHAITRFGDALLLSGTNGVLGFEPLLVTP